MKHAYIRVENSRNAKRYLVIGSYRGILYLVPDIFVYE